MRQTYRLMVVAAMVCGGMTAGAMGLSHVPQQQESKEEPYKEVPNPEKAAQRRTDEMNKVLNLTEKQYKKVYKLFLKEEKEKLEKRTDKRPFEGERPPRPQGGGMPPRDGGFGRRGMPPAMRGDMREEMQERMEKMDKKLKKILTDEQYETWQEKKLEQPEENEFRPFPELHEE